MVFENREPNNFKEIMKMDLAGYEITKAYYLKVDHGLMGTHPALISETDEIVVCLDKELLKRVWNFLPKKKAKVEEIFMLADVKNNFGFSLTACLDYKNEPEEVKPLHVLSEHKLIELAAAPEPFKWTPGVMDFTPKEERICKF